MVALLVALASITAAAPSVADSMAIGMATQKITITLGEEQVASVKALVEAGDSPSVSAFVQGAVGGALDDAAAWGRVLAEALEQSGGPLSSAEREWADEVLCEPESHAETTA